MLEFNPRMNRRRMLAAGAALTLAASWRRPIWAAEADSPTADLLIPGKDRRLIVHKSEPFEIETPLDLLRESTTTPVESMFVRNNFQPDWAATLSPPDAQRPWPVEVVGLLEFPRTITFDELAALPRIEHEMVVQCSGNGRAMFSAASPVKGSPWRNGAMANVRFGGVSLRSVFEKFDVRPHAAAKFLTAEGGDTPTKSTDADFEHSLPLAEALDRSMLALELNGKPLPAVHGGPLRLVTPGFYGTMHVKWLTRLRLDERETVNHHQVKRYRTPLKPIAPGSEFEYGLENSEPNWNMRIKSVVFSPSDGATLPNGKTTLSGVAWNDGLARIDAVEYSLDGGKQWRRAEMETPTSPYAWYRFEAELNLPSGKQVILCRAVDVLGRTQPRDGTIDWNPAGYGWRGADSVTVDVA